MEKFALAPIFESFLKYRYANIIVNKGYSSLSFLWDNCQRLHEKIRQFGVEHVHILYFGDFDPSGEAAAAAVVLSYRATTYQIS